MQEALGGWVAPACQPSRRLRLEESKVQGHPWFRTELQASLGHKLLFRKKLLTRKVWGALSWLINKHCTHSVSPGVWGGPHSQYRRRRPLQSDPWWPWLPKSAAYLFGLLVGMPVSAGKLPFDPWHVLWPGRCPLMPTTWGTLPRPKCHGHTPPLSLSQPVGCGPLQGGQVLGKLL